MIRKFSLTQLSRFSTISKAGPAPVNVLEFEQFARDYLPRNAYDYYSGGANDCVTLKENREAFKRMQLVPRILVDVTTVDTQTTVLGNTISSPICIAPTAMQQMAHIDGECATAKAAAKFKTLMTLSSWSSRSIEDVAAAAPNSLQWFQLYIYKDRDVTLDLVRRAERAGYKALAVTVDAPCLGRRENDIRNRFALPSHLSMGNFTQAGGFFKDGTKISGKTGSGLDGYVAGLIDKSLTFEDLKWLRKVTDMKIVVKGVMCAEDAKKSIEYGADVSNHGGRQLDTVPATISVLGEICDTCNTLNKEVYVDGGITRGTDVVKALVLGARAVFIGRPVLWGLAHSGEEGVCDVLKLLNDEFVLAMQLIGKQNVTDLRDRSLLFKK